jgi:hypothetical protein
MNTEHETLTQLVADALRGGLTYRALESKAVDPVTGYHPSRATLWKISKGQDIQLTPSLVRAVAASLGVSPERAQRAAAVQYAGYLPIDVGGATVLRERGAPESGLTRERAVVERWDKGATG